jgi:hypothetical protein
MIFHGISKYVPYPMYPSDDQSQIMPQAPTLPGRRPLVPCGTSRHLPTLFQVYLAQEMRSAARASTLEGQSLGLVCDSVIRLDNKTSVSTEIKCLRILHAIALVPVCESRQGTERV